jgi:hypothetical protein
LFIDAAKGSSSFEVITIAHSDDYLSVMNYCIAISSLIIVGDAIPYPFLFIRVFVQGSL